MATPENFRLKLLNKILLKENKKLKEQIEDLQNTIEDLTENSKIERIRAERAEGELVTLGNNALFRINQLTDEIDRLKGKEKEKQ